MVVIELPRHGVEALAAVACHGIDITDGPSRVWIDDFRWGTGGWVKVVVCSFACTMVAMARKWGSWRWHTPVQGVGQGIAISEGVRTGVGAEQ